MKRLEEIIQEAKQKCLDRNEVITVKVSRDEMSKLLSEVRWEQVDVIEEPKVTVIVMNCLDIENVSLEVTTITDQKGHVFTINEITYYDDDDEECVIVTDDED